MSEDAASSPKLAALDLVSWWMDAEERPLDFTTIHRFSAAPPVAAFAAGVESARRAFPVSGRRVFAADATWRALEGEDPEAFRSVALADGPAREEQEAAALRAFVDAPWELTRTLPVRQLVLVHRGATVATRFHHAACDGLGATLWLSHAFRVAFGETLPRADAASSAPLRLRHHRRASRKSVYASLGPAPQLRRGGPDGPRSLRAWQTLTFERRFARGEAGFAEDDLLAAAFLDALCAWDGRAKPFGLWLPINIRRRAGEGFGNGTSRIRVYATERWRESRSLAEKITSLAAQRRWSLRHGEWSVPSLDALLRAPGFLARAALRAYLDRPWVDVASAAFTRLPALEPGPAGDGEPARWIGALDGLESVGLLHRRHALSLIVVDQGEMRHCTFTFDPSWLGRGDVETIAGGFRERVERMEASRP